MLTLAEYADQQPANNANNGSPQTNWIADTWRGVDAYLERFAKAGIAAQEAFLNGIDPTTGKPAVSAYDRANTLAHWFTGNMGPQTVAGVAAGRITGALGAGPLRSGAQNTGVDLALRHMPSWTAEQRAAAEAKAQILNDADTVVLQTPRGSVSARTRYERAGGEVPARSDVDHKVDLQLGGAEDVENLRTLDSSVNRSLGAQVRQQTKNLPAGTRVNNVTIGDR
jgi:hypothetical protein